MILTRRFFLAGIGAGLIAPHVVDQFRDYIAVHGEPLVRAPANPVATLFVSPADDHLVYMRQMDKRTWRSLLALDRFDDPAHRAETPEYWQIMEDQLDEEISPKAYVAWSSRDLLVQHAAELLKSLDLGLPNKPSDRVGGIRFERPRGKIGCNEFAYCDDLLSVSLLQARLNELGIGIKVEL